MSDPAKKSDVRIDVDLVAEQFDALDSNTHREALLEAIRSRDVYRKLTEDLREKVEKLELGLIGPKSQRFKAEEDGQLSLAILAQLLGSDPPADTDPKALVEQLAAEAEAEAEQAGDADDGKDDETGDPGAHRRPRKPTGRRTAGERIAKATVEIVPDEVKRLGTDAFERIGEERSTTIERRVSSLVEVTVVRPKYKAKTQEAILAVKESRAELGTLPEQEPESWITISARPELPIEHGMAGPGLLANLIVRRFDDHLPYNRLENVYEREGMRLGRSTLYGWLDALRGLFAPLLEAMLMDARTAPYVCTDATGVLVQAPRKCSRGHFWVLVVPGRHVIFAFSRKHNAEAVDELLGDYKGTVVADAHSVFDHLYGADGATEAGCWGHARAYYFKTLASEPEIAQEFLGNLQVMFLLERKFASKSRKQRRQMRATKAKPIVDNHFALCHKYEDTALDGTPLAAAIRYSLNQEVALRRFLTDGRLPATNNISERNLRRQAVGRKNWLFVGSDDGAEVNTTFATLVASCRLQGIEPEAYLRDVLTLLPRWPRKRVLELAPCNWKQTREQPETQQRLEDDLFRSIMGELDAIHPD